MPKLVGGDRYRHIFLLVHGGAHHPMRFSHGTRLEGQRKSAVIGMDKDGHTLSG